MLTVHHLAYSQSERIVWLCEELGVPYELVCYEREPGMGLAPPHYRTLHPFGTAPVITDGAFALGESNAIVDYLIARHGGGRLAVGAGEPNFADYLYWLHFANGSFIPTSIVDHVLGMVGAGDTEATRALRGRGELAMEISERRLGEVAYFAGADFTAADIMMTMPLKIRRDLSTRPHIAAYLGRIGERPAYRRAMARIGTGVGEPPA